MKKRYKKCSCCNKTATWLYMPSGDGKRWYCDDCVPRGCTCNLCDLEFNGNPNEKTKIIWWSKDAYDKKWKEDDTVSLESLATKERMPDSFYYEYVDEKGRRSPCCEYWDIDDEEMEQRQYTISKKNINKILEESKYKLLISNRMKHAIVDFLSKLNNEGDYNYFMSKFHDVCKPYMKIGYNAKINRKFYLSVKDKLGKLKVKKPFWWEIEDE